MVGRNLVVPGYFASKRGLGIHVIGLHPGWVATEIVSARLEAQVFDPKEGDDRPVPMTVPARMIVYFASCAEPEDYTGRLFWAQREMAEMGISEDVTDIALTPA